MHKILKDSYNYYFSKNNKPALYVDENDIVEVHTLDCFSNDINSCPIVDFSRVNPATGPIYVNNALPGDVLKVEILDIKVGKKGIITTSDHTGALKEFHETSSKVFDIIDNKVDFNGISLDINPMIGVIGLASDELEIKTGHSYYLGGNMDSNVITKGSIVYFPIKVEGALLSMGDIHALMGDGEISGTGIETNGIITVRISIIKNTLLNYPLTETNDAYFVNTYGESAHEAIVKGYHELHRLIKEKTNWSGSDVTMYMSMMALINANQACLTQEHYVIPYDGPTFRVGLKKEAKIKLI